MEFPLSMQELSPQDGTARSRLPKTALAQASAWPTPATRDHKGSGDAIHRSDGKPRNDMLDWMVERFWQTPSVADTMGGHGSRGGDRSHELLLKGQAQELSQWATDGEKGGPNQAFGAGGTPLPAMASQWPTPTSLSFGDSHQPGNSRSHNLTMELASSLPVPAIDPHGEASQPNGQTSSRPQLNPAFVEWLMGWPPGWTSFACSETEWSRFKQRMRSAFLSMPTLAPAPPSQPDLFAEAAA